MEFEYDGTTLKFNRVLTDLDEMVLRFVSLLNLAKIKYVIISGYVAILFGRSRGTEDVDIFIEKISAEQVDELYELISKEGYWILNAESQGDAFSLLYDALAIRVAKKNDAVPNFEIKFPKKEIDFLTFEKRLKVVLNGKTVFISPLEIQIPFKLWLGTDKDLEDAMHLYGVFKDKLNKPLMRKISKDLKVEEKMRKYAIE